MDRARRAGLAALCLVIASPPRSSRRRPRASPWHGGGRAAAAVGVAAVDGLLVAEVVDRRRSASDEFVELDERRTDAGRSRRPRGRVRRPRTGSTVTRKATWAATLAARARAGTS